MLLKKIFSSDYFIAAYEVVFTLLISNVIILISAFFVLLEQGSSTSLADVFLGQVSKFVKPAEVIILVLALVAPAAWIILEHIDGWKHLRFGLVLIGTQFVILFLASCLYIAALNNKLNNVDLANTAAITFFFLALLVWYVTLVYKRKVIDKSGTQLKMLRRQSGENIVQDLGDGNEW